MWRIAFVVALVWFTTVPAATGKDRKPSKESSHNGEQYSRPTDPSLYVGAETCKTCHEDIFKNFETTPHWKTTFTKKGPVMAHAPSLGKLIVRTIILK